MFRKLSSWFLVVSVGLLSGCGSDGGASDATPDNGPVQDGTGQGNDNGNSEPGANPGQNTNPGEAGENTNPGQNTNPGVPANPGQSVDCASASRKTCSDLGKSCGQWSDGCAPIQCGECTGGNVCDNGKCTAPSSTAHQRATNPYEGTNFYINSEYVKSISASQRNVAANVSTMMEKVKKYPTAVWLDRIAAIAGTTTAMGVEGHLNEALDQQAKSGSPSKPVLVTFVVYDLPDRDCAAYASNGELKGDDGLSKYKRDYIDVIYKKITSNPAYKKLRIVTVVEPDSIPNLITNKSIAACTSAESRYKEGVRYAVSKLSEAPNVYIYLDIAHSGWLGWEHTPVAAKYYQEMLTPGGLLNKVRGFATNVANYTPWKEIFNPYTNENTYRSVIEGFYEYNKLIDENTYVKHLREYFPNHGFIVDTGRNGWQAKSETRPLDQRAHRGNWCNIKGAGIGERPKASPAPGIDAYVWVKPPGESDGTSDKSASSPNEEGKRFDNMCGQEPVTRQSNKSITTDAMANAPHAGKWFPEQFQMLVQNATPAL